METSASHLDDKSPACGAVTMINYRLEMTVDKHIHVGNTLVCQHVHALTMPARQHQKGQNVKHFSFFFDINLKINRALGDLNFKRLKQTPVMDSVYVLFFCFHLCIH